VPEFTFNKLSRAGLSQRRSTPQAPVSLENAKVTKERLSSSPTSAFGTIPRALSARSPIPAVRSTNEARRGPARVPRREAQRSAAGRRTGKTKRPRSVGEATPTRAGFGRIGRRLAAFNGNPTVGRGRVSGGGDELGRDGGVRDRRGWAKQGGRFQGDAIHQKQERTTMQPIPKFRPSGTKGHELRSPARK